MERAIVTGATGFIGSYFVNFLIREKVEVLALGRKDYKDISSERKAKLMGSKYLKVDMGNIASLGDEIAKIHWVVGDSCVFFNLAWGGKDRLSDLNVEAQMSNVSDSVEALKVAKNLGCEKFIQIGTMEEAFTQKYLELDHHINNEYNRHVIYSVAKIAAKNALQVLSHQLGVNLIYVLHSHVMAPDDNKDSFLQVTLQKLIKGEELVFSTGEQLFDVISAKDCSLGYYLICQKGIPGSEYWVGSGQPKRLREYVERMYNLYPSGMPMQFGKLPYNDIRLNESDFSISNLAEDTGYAPEMSYEEAVIELHESLINKQ
jgi:nucleoside-diphosphate-sugar epimerase